LAPIFAAHALRFGRVVAAPDTASRDGFNKVVVKSLFHSEQILAQARLVSFFCAPATGSPLVASTSSTSTTNMTTTTTVELEKERLVAKADLDAARARAPAATTAARSVTTPNAALESAMAASSTALVAPTTRACCHTHRAPCVMCRRFLHVYALALGKTVCITNNVPYDKQNWTRFGSCMFPRHAVQWRCTPEQFSDDDRCRQHVDLLFASTSP
jgi:hypothetical protein